MKKWTILLFLLAVNASSSESVINFESEGADYSLKKRGDLGQGLFKNGKFIRFYPLSTRDEVNALVNDLSLYDISSESREEIESYINDDFASKLKPASNEELLQTSLVLGAIATEALAEKEVECNEENGIKTSSNKKEKMETVYCECELPEGSDAKVASIGVPTFEGEYWDDYSILGKIESSSYTINTSNDNHLHGGYGTLGGTGDGNDRGRTFGLNLDYKLVGEEGEFRINYESVIFTQLYEGSSEDRFLINDKGELKQDLLERNRLDTSLRKRYDRDDYFIAGVQLEQLTDDGNVSGPIQKAWHKLSGTKNIQYDNQDFRDDEVNLTLYGGLGREWMKDLGNWKCTSRIEGTIGHNILNHSDSYIKVRGEVDLNSNTLLGGSKDNPFVLVSLWAEGSLETEGGSEKGAGVNMSFPVEVGKWQVKPQVGFSIKDEKEDRYFSQKQSIKLEPESHIGITFTRKF